MAVGDIRIRLRSFIVRENRRIVGEAATVLCVGLVTALVVFGALFWLSWLTFVLWLRDFRIGSAAFSALLVTSTFGLVSIVAAWRQQDPIQHVKGMNPTLHDLQLGLGYAMGVPVLNRQSIAGFASLFISGPANIMEGLMQWRKKIPIEPLLLDHASDLLQCAPRGVRIDASCDIRAVTLLLRSGLAKLANHENSSTTLTCTAKGLDMLNAARSTAA